MKNEDYIFIFENKEDDSYFQNIRQFNIPKYKIKEFVEDHLKHKMFQTGVYKVCIIYNNKKQIYDIKHLDQFLKRIK